MPSSVKAQLDGLPHKMLSMRGESLPKPLGDDLRRAIGQAIEQAVLLSKLTKQEVSFRMGYDDQASLSKWISGVENPQFARLWMVKELRAPLVLALAELSNEIQVETTLTIRRTA